MSEIEIDKKNSAAGVFFFPLVEQYVWCAHSDWRTDRSTLNTVFFKMYRAHRYRYKSHTDMFLSLSNWRQQQKRRKIGENSWRHDYRQTVWGPIARHAILSVDTFDIYTLHIVNTGIYNNKLYYTELSWWWVNIIQNKSHKTKVAAVPFLCAPVQLSGRRQCECNVQSMRFDESKYDTRRPKQSCTHIGYLSGRTQTWPIVDGCQLEATRICKWDR